MPFKLMAFASRSLAARTSEIAVLIPSDKDRRTISTRRAWLLVVRRACLVVLGALAWVSSTVAKPPADSPKTLQIYFIDVEGGQATLFVTPEHQSLLIDTGWPGNNGRDADRIVAAAHDAGISKIDLVLITHY